MYGHDNSRGIINPICIQGGRGMLSIKLMINNTTWSEHKIKY